VALVWVLGGWWILRHRFELLSGLSRAFVSVPPPGQSNPGKAADYIETARKRSHGVHLDLMARACIRFPLKYEGDLDFYRPHWLERYRDWNLAGPAAGGPAGENREPTKSKEPTLAGQEWWAEVERRPAGLEAAEVVEPDQYWKENKARVIDSLKAAINASVFAYDIPADTRPGWPAVHVPDGIAAYARAACLEPVALFARGDYIEHREAKARLDLLTEMPDFELRYTYEQDRLLFLLTRLKRDNQYRSSLQEYLGGSIPVSQSACRGRDYRLSCVAPKEALPVLQKIIYTAPSSDLPGLYVKLGSLHLLLGGKEHSSLAADFYTGGTQDSGTQRDARAGLVRSFLAIGDIERALEQLSQASLLYKDRGRTDGEFRELARSVLVKAGRFREADCFADLAELPSGEREHCRRFQL